MSLSDIVNGWAHQNVTFETPGTYDDYGNPSTGTATTYPAILTQKARLVRDRNGDQVVSSCQILLDGLVTIDPESKVTLPDGTQPRIINTGKTPNFDDSSNLVTEVYT